MKNRSEGWVLGPVEKKGDHIRITVGEHNLPAAYITEKKGTIIVQFDEDQAPGNQERKDMIVRELDFFFKELREPNPWAYAIYHCSTASNIYSEVHWANYVRKGRSNRNERSGT